MFLQILKTGNRTRRSFLIIFIIQGLFNPALSINGVIWNKQIEEFVPIFSISNFAGLQEKFLSKSHEIETHDFNGKIFRFTFYEETNIIEIYDNGTKITGVMGETWNLLAEYLNFTLHPILYSQRTLGVLIPPGNYDNGLLGVILRNKTDIIPRVELHVNRLMAAQLSIPWWKTRVRLYIRREVKHNRLWMLKLFHQRLWYAILWTYFLLSLCSYIAHLLYLRITTKKSRISLINHYLYNFGVMCEQNYESEDVVHQSKIMEVSLGFFSSLIRTAFSALLIGYMTQITNTVPFNDLDSLLSDTSYTVLSVKGTLPNLYFSTKNTPLVLKSIKQKRNLTMPSVDAMYRKICFTKKQYAVFEEEDIKKARGKYFCPINPMGDLNWDCWIVSGLSRKFEYKRRIDVGILKLHEVGLVNLLKQRWIESKNIEDEPVDGTEPICLDQVELIFTLFAAGALLSVIILIFENIVFYRKKL